MKRIAIIAAAALVLVGCGGWKSEVREINGTKVYCTWYDNTVFRDRDLRCEAVLNP